MMNDKDVMKFAEKIFTSMYIEYVNNFLSVEKFAEHYGISTERAEKIIDFGRELNDNN